MGYKFVVTIKVKNYNLLFVGAYQGKFSELLENNVENNKIQSTYLSIYIYTYVCTLTLYVYMFTIYTYAYKTKRKYNDPKFMKQLLQNMHANVFF